MSSKESLTIDRRSSSTDLEELDWDTQNLLHHERSAKQHKNQKKRNWVLLAVNIFVLLLNIGILLMMSVPKSDTVVEISELPRLPHADWIAPAVQWELETYDDKFAIHGRFRGKPRPELEDAWAEYVRNYTLRIPKPGWVNATSNAVLTEFQDDRGGIMGTFSFIHNIHCLRELTRIWKTIRQWMLPEYYPETREMYKPTPENPIPRHIDHCIDILRQSELCHADMSLLVFEWHEDNPHPVNLHHSPHVCANTDRVNKFLEENTVPPIGPILKHPWTGLEPWPFEEE
ncbi:hypothetical protein E8E14_011334 [Neopestalotiopsis sp. 37M]|nr:hypothetical protein E8E14_011334 [Neopestalotiopsis sp. 37M]